VVENEPADSPLRDVIYLGVLRGDFDAELTLEAEDDFARAVRSENGPRLTRNPLRWIAALVVAAFYPVIWLQWWASGPLLGGVTGIGRDFVQAWRSGLCRRRAILRRHRQMVPARWLTPVRRGAARTAGRTIRRAGLYLSYSRSEAAFAAHALREKLVAVLGITSIWDERELRAGTTWQDEIQRALERCTILVVFISRNPFGDDSAWQVEEIAHALAAGKRIVPVLLDGATLPASGALPPSIQGLTRYLALPLNADRLDADLDRLTDAIVRSVRERTNAK
jgi:signal transduction histidine kinase